MENEFVPFELAVKLKELGFNEKCFGHYHNEFNLDLYSGDFDESYAVLAPLWQQAFDWFRETKTIYSEVISINGTMMNNWEFFIRGSETQTILSDEYKTYEEARQACLEKLIEIVLK